MVEVLRKKFQASTMLYLLRVLYFIAIPLRNLCIFYGSHRQFQTKYLRVKFIIRLQGHLLIRDIERLISDDNDA